jgi:hypothetical protein
MTSNTSYSPGALVANTTYYWQIVAGNAAGSTSGPVWSFVTSASSLPSPWQSQDVGSTGQAGSSIDGNGTFTIRGGGADVWGSADAFQFAYQTLSGDGVIVARVTGIQNTSANAKAGIMFRSSLAANAANVILDLNPTGNIEFMARTSDGGSTGWLSGTTQLAPVWLELVRAGSTITGFVSTDGTAWTQVGSTTLAFAARIDVGLVVCSHDTTTLNTSTFDSVAINAATPPGTPASPSPANTATGVSVSPTLTWSAAGATAYDVAFGASNPPPTVTTGQSAATYTPATLAAATTYFWQITAHNGAGTTAGSIWSFTTAGATSPPGVPGSPSPANAAIGVNTTPTLAWSATGATSYDVNFGTSTPPPSVSTGQSAASFAPPALLGNTTYFWQITAHNSSGATAGPTWSFTTAAATATDNIVLYASDIATANIHGAWSVVNDATAAAGVKATTPTTATSHTSGPLATPTDYVDMPFNAPAGTPYTLWLRVAATNNSKSSDSLYVQFSDALAGGAAIDPLGTTQGLTVNLATDSTAASDQQWGWVNGAYWLSQSATFTFANSGSHTLRIQLREAGVMFDQIVLSPSQFLNPSASCPTTCGGAPGPVSNDATIVPKPTPLSAPAAPANPSPANNAGGVGTSTMLTWSSSGATSYDVALGTHNPPATVSSGHVGSSYSTGGLTANTTYFWQITAHNSAGATTGAIWSFTTAQSAAPSNVVIYASDIPSSALHGVWQKASDSTSPNNVKLVTPVQTPNPTSNAAASPTDFVDITFTANAGVPYTLWLRLQATNNSKFSDSIYLQFSDALVNGASVYPIGTTESLVVNLATDGTAASDQLWGWVNGAYWLTQAATVSFASSGSHTLRIQVREYGVQFDQIVLSPSQFYDATASCPTSCAGAPGPVSNDGTIVPKS